MNRTRRVILKLPTIPVAASIAFACSKTPNPSPTAPSTQPQQPVAPTAEVITPPPTYLFAVKVGGVGFDNVFRAFDAAKVTHDSQQTLSGLKVREIGTVKSDSIKIDINEVPFCTAAGLTAVPAKAIIACYIEDGRKVTGSCISDRPF